MRRVASRGASFFRGGGAKTVLAGLGAATVGALVGQRVGVSPTIIGGGVGFATGGMTGALIGAFGTQIMQMAASFGGQPATNTAVAGNVWA